MIFVSIYLDTLVTVNTYISFLIISASARSGHLACPGKRKAAASLLGGLSSLIILIPPGGAGLKAVAAILKILSCGAIAAAAFYRKGMSIKKFASSLGLIILMNVIFGGLVYFMQAVLYTDIIYINSCSYYFDISLGTLVILSGIIYLIITAAAQLTSRRFDAAHSYRVEFSVGDKSYVLDGVADTGNSVYDIFSGRAVIICTGMGDSPPSERITAVPYSTVSGEGLLYAFKPDKVYIESDDGIKRLVSALVAFSGGSEKRAVFNPKILV